jgi:ubiquinone/menaquinone biosynthesis C-methylase UbiE
MTIVHDTDSVRVVDAFNSVANIFEQTLENDTTRGLRQKVYATIHQLVSPGSRILDLNCGIGIDAVTLAERGYTVVGLDIAPKMIDEAKQRAKRNKVTNAEFLVGSFEDLSPLTGHAFDLVLSNFGGINCAASLDAVAEQVARVIRPGGYFVAMVMPPVCPWEIIAGLSRFNFKSAFRRLRANVQATGFRGGTFTVHYYSPKTVAMAFRTWFEMTQLCGLNIVSPPPHAMRFQRRYPRFSSFLQRVEERINRLPLVKSAGDHSLIVLKRIIA